MTLRLGHKNKDLALRFNISEGVVSKIFRLWIKQLAFILCNLIVWPDRDASQTLKVVFVLWIALRYI